MRASTKEHMKKVQSKIEEGIPMKAKDLAKRSRMSVGSIYRVIKLLRSDGVPIMRTKSGYLHAAHAEKRDDVYVLRMINGRHAADVMMLEACRNEMQKRWHNVEERKQLMIAMSPLTPSMNTLQRGMKLLQEKSARLGI